jgi:hypothetical protein
LGNCDNQFISRFQRFGRFARQLPGPLGQAITFRAFGADQATDSMKEHLTKWLGHADARQVLDLPHSKPKN